MMMMMMMVIIATHNEKQEIGADVSVEFMFSTCTMQCDEELHVLLLLVPTVQYSSIIMFPYLTLTVAFEYIVHGLLFVVFGPLDSGQVASG